MRVWVINHYAVPPTQPGGTRHHSLARELIRRGHEVLIVASSFHHATRREAHLRGGEAWKWEVVDGVPFLWLRTPTYAGNTAARLWNMLVFSSRLWLRTGLCRFGKPDVILGSSPHLFAAYAAQRVAARLGVPFVLEVRDLWPETLVELGSLSRRHPLVQVMACLERHLYRAARRVIVLLPGADAHVLEKGADRAKVIWIPNGVDSTALPDPNPPGEHGVFKVVYAGAHGLANYLDVLLDAMALLRIEGTGQPVTALLVGDGPEKPMLQKRADELSLDNVEFHDPVPKNSIYRLLQQADAFYMGLREAKLFRWGISPNKLFDYLGCARPVIFAVSSDYNPVKIAGAGVTVQPGDARALAKAVRQLARLNPAERWEMGLRGRRYVEEHHCFSRLAERLEAVLLEVAGE